MVGRIVFRLMLVVLALTVSLLLWIGFTSSGLGAVLARVPGLVITGEVKGTVFDTIELNRFEYKNNGVELSAEQLLFDWQPIALFGRELRILKLNVHGLSGRSEPAPKASSDEAFELDLPFNVVVDHLHLESLSWSHDQAKPIEVEMLDFSGGLTQSLLNIQRFEVLNAEESMSVKGNIDVSLRTDGQLDLEFEHRLNSTVGFTESLVGAGAVQGTWQSFEFQHATESPYQSQSSARIENALEDNPNWQLSSKLENFVVPGQQDTETVLSGDVRSNGGLLSNTLQSELDIRSHTQRYSAKLDAIIEGRKVSLNQFSISKAEQTPSMSIVGEIENYQDLFSNGVERSSFSLTGEWNSLNFLSAILNTELPASEGKLLLNGNLNRYSLELKFEIQNPQFQQLKVSLTGKGNENRFNTDVLSVVGDGVQLNSSMALSFNNQRRSLALSKLTGEYRGQTVTGKAQAAFIGPNIEVDELNLNIGGAKLIGQGLLGDVSNFEWTINAADLSLLLPESAGSISASGTLNGQLDRPVVSSDVSLARLSYQGFMLESAEGNVEFGFAKQSVWNGELKLGQLMLADRAWLEEAKLTLSGSLEQHTVNVAAKFADSDDAVLVWRGGYIDQSLKFSGSVNNLPVAAIRPYTDALPFEVAGNVGTEFSGSYNFAEKITLESTTKANNLVFESKSENESDVVLNDFSLELSSSESVQLNLSAQLQDGGSISGQASSIEPLLSAQFPDSGVSGRFNVDYPNLKSLQAVLPPSINAEGKFNATAQLSGIVRSPQLVLNASISDGLLELPQQGVDLQQIALSISSASANRFQVTGSAQAGLGSINLEGDIDISNHELPSSALRLIASDALFINTPEIKAQGDADLHLNIVENRLDISGSLIAKKADIKIASAMSAVRESPDLVLQGLEPKENALGITMALDLDLGDNSVISASGLTGRLVGKPSIKLDQKGLLSSVGEIKVVDGSFLVIGQKLKIDKGVASYAGGAIDNPWLSFEATKTIGNTRAGIAIEGNADSPELSLFSQPDYEDQDILALVFFEKRLDQLSSIDALTLVRIANALRGGNTDSKIDAITDDVADYLGVDKLDVSFDSQNDERSVSLSSKINSKLDIGYAYNFISSLQALFLRYKINSYWSIQSSVDVESGADVLYKIERD